MLIVGLLWVVAPTASAQACATTYIVRPGDTLFSIGLRFGMTADVVARANGILNPNAIYAGQALCIPGAGYPPPLPPPPPGTCTYYTGKFGDTLGSIAVIHGTTISVLQRANNLVNPNLLYAGMALCIPGSGNRPPTFPQWRGEYFNNPNLAGAPSVVRNDKAINFDWGIGWPDPRISADNFSARWSRSLFFNTGTFRLTARADDGIRVFVDDVLVIDEWHAASGATYTQDITLGTGNHTFRVQYYESAGAASVFFTWARISGAPGGTPIPGPTPSPTGGASGVWTGCYYTNKNRDVSGQPTMCRIDPWIAFNWGVGSPDPLITADLFGARWTSSQSFQAGTYRFFALVDDGVRLYVDDKLVIDEWFEHNGTTLFADVPMTAGVHSMKVEYFEFGHEAQIYVWWEKQ
jgi:LysM repeat protein